MGTGSFPGIKRPGRGVDHRPPSSAEVKERVELYLYSPSWASWPVIGWPLPLLTRSLTSVPRSFCYRLQTQYNRPSLQYKILSKSVGPLCQHTALSTHCTVNTLYCQHCTVNCFTIKHVNTFNTINLALHIPSHKQHNTFRSAQLTFNIYSHTTFRPISHFYLIQSFLIWHTWWWS